jgi:hypothetical protein
LILVVGALGYACHPRWSVNLKGNTDTLPDDACLDAAAKEVGHRLTSPLRKDQSIRISGPPQGYDELWFVLFFNGKSPIGGSFATSGEGVEVHFGMEGPNRLDRKDTERVVGELKALYEAVGEKCQGNWSRPVLGECIRAECSLATPTSPPKGSRSTEIESQK